jgi:nifR3 family TIM-barrel protein
MSVNLAPSNVAPHPTSRPIAEIARHVIVDPRITGLVPQFDAPFFQAGLAGYSDGAMRLIARQHGCPFCVTEALLDRTLVNGGKGRRRENPDVLAEECGTGDLSENRVADRRDHPIAGQVMGTHPDEMARGAEILVAMGYDVIDVNLACPVKKIRRRNRGGHFLAYPVDAIAVLTAVRNAVPATIPVTVKMRRGYDDTNEMAQRFERIFEAAYELDYAWATVHCRTVDQRYLGPGRWSFLTELVARYDDRLIFGSGDIWSADDIFAMLDTTGVQAVSVARGCIGNPWIFRQARQLLAGQTPTSPTLSEQRDALLDHFDLSARLHGEGAASRMMRKFGIKFSIHHPRRDHVKSRFVCCRSAADWRAILDQEYVDALPL